MKMSGEEKEAEKNYLRKENRFRSRQHTHIAYINI